jgi:hypothetical protein
MYELGLVLFYIFTRLNHLFRLKTLKFGLKAPKSGRTHRNLVLQKLIILNSKPIFFWNLYRKPFLVKERKWENLGEIANTGSKACP